MNSIRPSGSFHPALTAQGNPPAAQQTTAVAPPKASDSPAAVQAESALPPSQRKADLARLLFKAIGMCLKVSAQTAYAAAKIPGACIGGFLGFLPALLVRGLSSQAKAATVLRVSMAIGGIITGGLFFLPVFPVALV